MLNAKKTKQIHPLQFPYYFWTIAVFVFSGLADSVYLSISHYRVYNDIAYESFCAISRPINCDTVSQSPYSIFIGVPVPVWGIIGYSFFMLLLPFARSKEAQKQRIWPVLFFISLAFNFYCVFNKAQKQIVQEMLLKNRRLKYSKDGDDVYEVQ